jgi:hypothetical protein
LRTDAPLFKDVDELRWTGPAASFESVAKKIGDERLATRVRELQKSVIDPPITQTTQTRKKRGK